MKHASANIRPAGRAIRLWLGLGLAFFVMIAGWKFASSRSHPESASRGSNQAPPKAAEATAAQSAMASKLAEINRARNRPIDVTVEVIDQSGHPVPGASVAFETGCWIGAPGDYLRSDGKRYQATVSRVITDQSGRAQFKGEASSIHVAGITGPGVIDHPWNQNDLLGFGAFDQAKHKEPARAANVLVRQLLVWKVTGQETVRPLQDVDFFVTPGAAIRVTALWESQQLIAKKIPAEPPAGSRAWPLEFQQLRWNEGTEKGIAQIRAKNGRLKIFNRGADSATSPQNLDESALCSYTAGAGYQARFVYRSTDGQTSIFGELTLSNLGGAMRVQLRGLYAAEPGSTPR